MTKHILGISFLALALLCGCERAIMREQQNASLPLTESPPIDLNASIARAKAENKIVLLDFTGSDWCPPCMALHRSVFSKPEFKAYAESNLVFHVVDFPDKFRLPPAAMETNNLLAQQFKVDGVPTLIALDGNGSQIWKQVGFLDGGPGRFITTLEKAKQKAK